MEPVTELVERYRRPEATAEEYVDGVDQLAHALQCAALARDDGAGDALVAAALLHDVGHLLGPADDGGVDRHHEAVGARHLRRWFGPDVTAPIALHVAAKRYLCATDPGYAAELSPGSLASLTLQGGPMTAAECAAFESRPGWHDAVRLRRWDDLAKVPDLACPDLTAYEPLLRSLATR